MYRNIFQSNTISSYREKPKREKEVEEDFTVIETDYEKYNEGDHFDYNNVTRQESD